MRRFLALVRWPRVALAAMIVVAAGLSVWWVSNPTPSGTALERGWTAIALWALLFTCWLLDNSIRDFNAVRTGIRLHMAVVYGPRWWIALASMVTCAVMYVIWIGFAIIGILSLSISPTSPEQLRMRIGTVTGIVLVTMTVLLAAIQAWQVYARNKVKVAPPYPTFRPDSHPFMQSHPKEDR
jgi:hypothetical protein